MKNEKGDLKIKTLTVTTAIVMLASGFKIVSNSHKAEALREENTRLKEEFEQILLDELHNTQPAEIKYVVTDEIEVDGRTIKIVSKPTSTPTPTPTPEPEYSRYINIDSDEFTMIEDGVYHEKEPEVKLDFNSVNEMIAFYSNVFQLNDVIVGNKIYELIELEEDAWDKENTLNGNTYDSKEQAIARVIADMSNYPEDYELSDIEVDEYKLDQYEPEELIYKFSDVIGVNPYIALSIAYGESGTKLDSYNFETRHNVGGLRRRSGDPHPATSWGLAIYKNEAEGLYRFITILHDNFFVDKDSGIDRINAMSYSYCEDSAYWRGLVGSLYYNLTSNGYSYYYDKFSYERDLVYPTSSEVKTI